MQNLMAVTRLEGRAELVVNGAKILKTGGARHGAKQKPEVIALAVPWADKVHAPNGFTAAPSWVPSLVAEGEMLWKVGVQDVASRGVGSLVFEVGCEGGVSELSQNVSWRGLGVKHDALLVWQVHGKSHNRRCDIMQWVVIQPPAGFRRGHPATIKILADLIAALRVSVGIHPHHGTVRAFVHVLVEIFDGFDSAANLYVHVAIVFGCKVGVVRYHP
jgi:hypothetical protein